MKKIIAFIFLVTFFTIPTLLVFAQSTSTQAEGTSTGWHLTQGEGGCMEIELPFIPKCGATPASYLSGLYRLALGLGVLAALIMIVVAGITYATSGDNASKQKEARGQIRDAIIGMVILFASVLILNTINPDIASMKLPIITPPSLTSAPATSTISKLIEYCVYGEGGIGGTGRGGCVTKSCDQWGYQKVEGGNVYRYKDERKYKDCLSACYRFCSQKYNLKY